MANFDDLRAQMRDGSKKQSELLLPLESAEAKLQLGRASLQALLDRLSGIVSVDDSLDVHYGTAKTVLADASKTIAPLSAKAEEAFAPIAVTIGKSTAELAEDMRLARGRQKDCIEKMAQLAGSAVVELEGMTYAGVRDTVAAVDSILTLGVEQSAGAMGATYELIFDADTYAETL